MNVTKIFLGRWILRLASVSLALVALPAPADEVLIEGFERAGELKTSGNVAVVKGADAVTEGASALQLAPGATVTIRIPAQSVNKVGWLKIDTFEVQPVMASLQLTLQGVLSRTGYVCPGKDTLALPLGLAARTYRGAWPKQAVTLELRNTGPQAVVVDNVRLVSPADPPAGAILLDFGPASQALWPGFEHAASEGAGIAWSGEATIHSFTAGYPDPLLGDFAGLRPAYKTLEALALQSKDRPGMAWAWLTHYSYNYSAPLEYMARINGRLILRRRLTPAQMLSPAGLLEGKNEPWTTEWFEQSFAPKAVSKLEFSLKAGKNLLELANCQLAALIIARRTDQNAVRTYVQQLEQDLKRYRRQFVLAVQYRPRCNVTPTEEETKAGSILFLPPRDEWFNRTYVPAAEHRGKSLKLTVAAGSLATTALVAVPCKDGRLLQARLDVLRDPGKGPIPNAAWRLYAMETMPVVRDACVYYQPFLPATNFRNVRAGGVYWFVLRVAVPERTRAGNYSGTIRLTLERTSAELPVDLEVVRIRPDKTDEERTFAVLSSGGCFEVYRSLRYILPDRHQARITREIFAPLFDAGLNAAMVRGPTLSRTLELVQSPMVEGLRIYPRLERSGKAQVSLTGMFGSLRAGRRPIQPGTARYLNITRDVVKLSNDLADKGGLGNYALYCGHAGRPERLPEVAKRVAAVRRGGGRPAISAYASHLSAMAAKQRAALLADLDTLICIPDHKDLGGIAEQLKKTGDAKTVALHLIYPDVYAAGFYCWGVGADGAYAGQIFNYRPLYNAFSFSPQSLLLPTPKGGFAPTLTLLKLRQGIDDYDLARRCQALVKAAAQRSIDAKPLEKILTEIRIVTDSQPPRYDRRLLRAGSVSPQRLHQWRESLSREAAKVSEKMAESPRRK